MPFSHKMKETHNILPEKKNAHLRPENQESSRTH